jgi:hypothetical protein
MDGCAATSWDGIFNSLVRDFHTGPQAGNTLESTHEIAYIHQMTHHHPVFMAVAAGQV